MVDLETIKKLVALMVENDLAEVAIRDGQEEIALKRAQLSAGVVMAAAPVPALTAPPSLLDSAVPAGLPADPDAGLTAIPSPMVGTYYSGPDPASPPFVKVGDHVTPNMVVCIIEAMKVFNEIKAGTAGVIRRVLASNESAVEYGQPMFMVQPD